MRCDRREVELTRAVGGLPYVSCVVVGFANREVTVTGAMTMREASSYCQALVTLSIILSSCVLR